MRPAGAVDRALALLTTILSVALLASPCVPALALEAVDRRTGCRFDLPPDWEGAPVQWLGDCPAGKADGLGIVTQFRDGVLVNRYFGAMAKGLMDAGVLEVEGGYRAGGFAAGRPVVSEDRNFVIQAFRTAAEAARRASAIYQEQGNLASARHYAREAERLATQMD